MPQMAPMNWMILLLYFLMIFLIFNFINYFSFLYNAPSLSFTKKEKTWNWKW